MLDASPDDDGTPQDTGAEFASAPGTVAPENTADLSDDDHQTIAVKSLRNTSKTQGSTHLI